MPLPGEFGEEIRKRTGVWYLRGRLHALMARAGLLPRTVTKTRVDRALRRNMLRWQARIDARLDRLRKNGHAVAAVGEAFPACDTAGGIKHWPLVGRRIPQPHAGSS